MGFTEAGGVEPRAELADGAGPEWGVLRIEATGTGLGTPKADPERIFGRLAQVDGTSAREDGGTGLGLAITRAIVRKMDGDVTAASTPGSGPTFRVGAPVSIVASVPSADDLERAAA